MEGRLESGKGSRSVGCVEGEIAMQIRDPRQQLDHMLRQTRNNLVSFSQMADTKAQILLSLSSVLLSLSLTQIHEPRLTLALAGLDIFLLITIYLALMTVIGKVSVFKRRKHSVNDHDYSPLFFGNYGDIPYDEYARHFAEIMNDSDATYEIMVKDIYYAGTYLLRTKYKYMRLAYLCFLAGLIVSCTLYFLQNFL
jgi:Pycsar effector protein